VLKNKLTLSVASVFAVALFGAVGFADPASAATYTANLTIGNLTTQTVVLGQPINLTTATFSGSDDQVVSLTFNDFDDILNSPYTLTYGFYVNGVYQNQASLTSATSGNVPVPSAIGQYDLVYVGVNCSWGATQYDLNVFGNGLPAPITLDPQLTAPAPPNYCSVNGGTNQTTTISTGAYAEVNVVAQVSFDANGGTGTMAPINTDINGVLSTNPLPANAFTRSGYTFTGWNTAANGSGIAYVNGATLPVLAANETLYAQWSANATGILPPSAGVNDLRLTAIVSGIAGVLMIGTVAFFLKKKFARKM